MSPNPSLYVNEIFNSVSGEVGGFPQGSMATFVRFQGCNLNCGFCDAGESRKPKEKNTVMSIGKIISEIQKLKSANIVITGGEPFIQDENNLFRFITILDHYEYQISIETNGSIEVPFPINEMCHIVMDFKLDKTELMPPLNFLMLKNTDFVKFVIQNQQKMDEAIKIVKMLKNNGLRAKVAFSPMLPYGPALDRQFLLSEMGRISAIIIKGIRQIENDGILNLQIHKLIGAR